jgi:hypothetical protein
MGYTWAQFLLYTEAVAREEARAFTRSVKAHYFGANISDKGVAGLDKED